MNLKEQVSKNVKILKTSNFSKLPTTIKRVLRDLRDFESMQPKLPNFNVFPLEDNILEWHGNIKGLENSIYDNGIFHFKMIIPEDYPKNAPKISFFTSINHPNIINKTEICLDILETKKCKNYFEGWNNSYTITTIFTQLHNFLNDGEEKLGYKKSIIKAKKNLEKNKNILKVEIEKILEKIKNDYPENVENILKSIENLNLDKIKNSFDEILKDINSSKLYKLEEYVDNLMEKFKYYENDLNKEKLEDKKLLNIITSSSLTNKEMINWDSIFKIISKEKINKIKILANKIKKMGNDEEKNMKEIHEEINKINKSNAKQMEEIYQKIIDLQNNLPENLKNIFDGKIKEILDIKNKINLEFKDKFDKIKKKKEIIITMEKNIKLIQDNIKNNVNKFHCTICDHGKLLSDNITRKVVPEIQEVNLEDFVNKKSQKELYEEELRCFHSNISFKECNLGYGIKVLKKPITGEIRISEPSNCIISLNSFHKEFVRKDLYKRKFNYYIPMFTGNYKKEVEDKLTKKSCSYILKNSVDRFEQNDLRNLIPTLLYGSIMNIIEEKVYPNHSYIRILINLILKNLKLIDEDKEYETNLKEKISNFKNNEEFRHKNIIQNLAIISIQAILTKEFDHSKDEILSEMFIRQIFWIIIKIKGFEDFDRLSTKTLNYIFEECKTGYLMFSVIFKINSLLNKYYSVRKNALIYGEENYGLLCYEFENNLHSNLLKILAMNTFEKFFKFINKKYSVEIVEDLFRKNIKISLEKGYHGNVDNYLGKKTIEEQYKEYDSNYDDFLKILDENKSDDEYKNILFKNFKTVERLYNQCKIPLIKIMKILDHHDFSELMEDEIGLKEFITIKQQYLKNYKNKKICYHFYKENYSFKDAYIKLSIEKELKYIFLPQNIKRIHEICNRLENYEIDCLLLPCVNINKIKSKYFYINIILNKLKKVKNYIIKPLGINFNLKFFNELEKAFNKKSESSDKIDSLNIFYLDNYKEDQIELFKIINKIYYKLDDLKCIKWYYSNILQNYKNKKFFLNILIKNKNLKEINIDGNQLKCGDIFEGLIDGLMKSKSIENLILKNLVNNNELIELFLYNLTFSKNLKYLNIKGVNNYSNNDKFWSNLGKLVSISNDLIKLNLKNIKSSKFINKFFDNIGNSNSLKILNLSKINENVCSNDLKILAKNIAFNSKLSKNQCIEELYLDNLLNTADKSNKFFEGMKISNKELAIYEGEEEIAKNMSNKHNQTFLSNGLKILSIENSNIENIKDISAKVKNGQKIPFIEFLRYSNSLEYLNLNNLTKNNSLINFFWGAYNQNLYEDLNKNSKIMSRKENKYNEYFVEEDNDKVIRKKFICKPKLKVLLLDNCGIINDNVKILKKILNFLNLEILSLRNNLIGISLQNLSDNLNKNLRVLDLYKNLIGIDGSRKLSENISKSNLEYLDLGFNNIKNKGILGIINKLISNKNEKLLYLGISQNNFKDYTIEFIIDNLINKNLNLKGIFCKHNIYNNFNINSNYLKSKDLECFIDCFNRLKYFPNERFERMIWIPKFFEKKELIRIFSNVIKKKKLFENLIINIIHKNDFKKNHLNNNFKFTLIEFLNEYSIKKVIHIIQRRKLRELSNIKVYKASTSTYNYIKFKKKFNKRETRRENYDNKNNRENRNGYNRNNRNYGDSRDYRENREKLNQNLTKRGKKKINRKNLISKNEEDSYYNSEESVKEEMENFVEQDADNLSNCLLRQNRNRNNNNFRLQNRNFSYDNEE